MTDTLLDAYEAAADEAFKAQLEETLRGVLINLYQRAKRTQVDGQSLIMWPALKNPSVMETGYCYGQAGLVLPLLRLAEVLPDLKLADGTTALSLANANLRYLASIARRQGRGYVWPYMRHSKASRNIGYGSGTGGIGWAFLRGAQVNRKTNSAFADECMKYAKGAVVYAVELLARYQKAGPLTSPGGDAGFGVCGGAVGGGHLLMLYATEVGDKEPELVKRIDASIRKIAQLVIASAVEFDDGTLACPDRVNFKRVNLALDYGQTGIVMALAAAGKYLRNDELVAAAKKVADYIAKRAVPEGGGLKFAQFHPLPK